MAYGLLTLLLAGCYAVVALGLGQLLGQDSSLAVAGATLAVAAAFQPARRRIQAAVDRRFNRRRYDAAHTIAAFNGRLREQVDLATLTAELPSVADQPMQPTQASLWLRPQEPPDAAARTAVSRLHADEQTVSEHGHNWRGRRRQPVPAQVGRGASVILLISTS